MSESAEHDKKNDNGADSEHAKRAADSKPLYSVQDVPPWYLCVVLGFQHFLTAFGSMVTVPLYLASYFCMAGDNLGISELLSTMFFVCGIATLLQTTFGVRLPILQGSTFSFVVPTVAFLSQPQWACPYNDLSVNQTLLPEQGSDEHRDMWMLRLREVQGAVMVASIFQVVIGFTGLIGILLRFIGPLGVTPTIVLIGLSLFAPAANRAATHWWIAITTIVLITIFSQFLRNVDVPFVTYKRGKGWKRVSLPIFKLFPVLLAMLMAWLICYILTITDTLPTDPNEWGYQARTDTRSHVLTSAAWFRFPYPGQWGMPVVSAAGVFGILSGVLASVVESVGDYYACARLSGASSPPDHAVNRGIGIEGLGCILAGAWGTGNGTTSFSENVGAIGITKVGSRRVVQFSGAILMVLGCLGKFGALFVTVPDPVIGGMFLVMFGMITAVGLSTLQYVDLNSTRNLFIVGFSIFFGLSFPNWMETHGDTINTGSEIVDQILMVLCSTSMFVGGGIGILLDNIIPGTDAERGIKAWREVHEDADSESTKRMTDYDLPLIQNFINRWRWSRYLPFCPSFQGFNCRPRCMQRKSKRPNFNSSPQDVTLTVQPDLSGEENTAFSDLDASADDNEPSKVTNL